jgi:hypothetical protein
LIEKETIDGDEFRQIVAEYTFVPEKEQYVPQNFTLPLLFLFLCVLCVLCGSQKNS